MRESLSSRRGRSLPLPGVLLSTAIVTGLTVAAFGGSTGAQAAPAEPAPLGASAIQGLDAPRRIADSYIVTFKDGQAAVPNADRLAKKHGGKITHVYRAALNGFAVKLSESAARALAADPAVAHVEADRTITLIDGPPSTSVKGGGKPSKPPKPTPTPTPTPDPTPTDPTPDPDPDPTPTDPTPDPDPTPTPEPGDIQADPPSWGLDRIDQAGLPLDSSYTYPGTAANVHAYIIDTGIRTTHTDFGGRATWGTNTTADGIDTDCNGHGTHVAGTTGGAAHGVAKGVQLVGVKVLDCGGSGTYAGVVAGVDWVTANAVKPAVANMSLGGGPSQALDEAIARSTASGITYAVAAGNENVDACGGSPASAPSAITVGATTSTDARSSYSNFGSCLDIFAPGSAITSAWITSDTATNTINGTSMAAPHVAGDAALIASANPTWTPQEIRDTMVGEATDGVVTSPGAGSPNKLLRATSAYVADEFSLSLGSSSGAVTVGQSVTTDVTTTSVRGTAENVTFTADGLPRDATVTFDPATVTAGGGSTMTVATQSTTPNGTYTIRVSAASPSTTHSATYTLVVSGGPCENGQKLVNPGFEEGDTGWTADPATMITQNATTYPPHSGQWYVRMGGLGTTHTESLSQPVSLPAGCSAVTLNYALRVDTREGSSAAWDKLKVEVRSANGTQLLATLKTHSNLDKSAVYIQRSADLTQFAGQSVMIRFVGTEDSSLKTWFLLDDVTVDVI